MRQVWYIAFAHTTIDFYMVLTPPLYALLKSHFKLSLFQVSLLPSIVSVFGAIIQPFMGYIGDRRNRMTLVALGVFICGFFISSISFAPNALILGFLLIGASLGSSLFHPSAGGLVTAIIPHRSNLAMSIFLTGGTLGMSIAPVTSTQIVEHYGLEYLWILVIPSLIFAPLLYHLSKNQEQIETKPVGESINWKLFKTSELRPLWTLYAISLLRSLTHTGFVAFISLLGQGRGWSIGEIGWIFSGYLLSSTLGRISGGYLGDRISPHKLLAFSSVSSAIFHLGFCLNNSPNGIFFFFLGGFFFDLGVTTSIILAQKVLPRNTSTATGLMMGFSWGIAGLAIPLIGRLADFTSLSFALGMTSAFLFPAAILVTALPNQDFSKLPLRTRGKSKSSLFERYSKK